MRPMFDGMNMARVRMGLGGMTWDYVDQLKKGTKMKVLLKGIVNARGRCARHRARRGWHHRQ